VPGPSLDRRAFLRVASLATLGAAAAACSKGATGIKPSPTPTGTGSPSPSPTATAPTRSLAWRPLSVKGPKARSHHSFTANAEGSIAFLFGGKLGSTVLRDAWAYERSTGLWQPLPYGPPARFGHTSAFVDGHWVIFGGQNGSELYNDAWAFDSVRGEWLKLSVGSKKPVARSGASGCTIANSLTVSHGAGVRGGLNDTWALSSHWTNVTPKTGTRPGIRSLHRAAYVSSITRMVLFGGQAGHTLLNDTWLYDPTKLEWSEFKGAGPSPRNLSTVGSTDNFLYLFGGASRRGPLRDLWSFDGNAWRSLKASGTQPRARTGAEGAVIAGPTMLMFGGTDGSHELPDFWELSLPS
jgi:galactose oxidase-like protein/Kelch motif protein